MSSAGAIAAIIQQPWFASGLVESTLTAKELSYVLQDMRDWAAQKLPKAWESTPGAVVSFLETLTARAPSTRTLAALKGPSPRKADDVRPGTVTSSRGADSAGASGGRGGNGDSEDGSVQRALEQEFGLEETAANEEFL